ncbi:phosphatidylethanolamine-binding protein [Mycena vulgaris]|nr:phosphatidylethanolamine-binding protein [Mycena vulgaris]
MSSLLAPLFLLSALIQASEVCAIAVTDTSLTTISTAFSNAGIVPGVIPVFKPSGILDVVFTIPSTGQAVNATPGTNLTVQQTVNEPQFFLTADNTTASDTQFVIALFDPDAPTPQNTSLAQFRHLVGGGYRWGANGLLTNSSAALTEFVPPGPPPGSDPHRYMVLVFLQSQDFASKAPYILNSSTPRTNFNITALSDALGLGAPFSGTFFFTGPDTSGPSGPNTSEPSSASNSTGTGAKPTDVAGSSARSRNAQLVVPATFTFILICFMA